MDPHNIDLPVNPLDLPDDIDGIASLMGIEGELGEMADDGAQLPDEANATSTPDDAQVDTNEIKEDKAIESNTPAVQDEPLEPQGVLTADGKHVIPYEVLKNVRSEGNELRTALGDAQQEVERLRAQVEAGTNVQADTSEQQGATEALQAKLSEMSDEYPDFAETFGAVASTINSLQGQVANLSKDNESRVEREQETVRDQQLREQNEVQEAIDNNPDLTLWKENDPGAWQQAIMFDQALRGQAEFKDASLQERFGKVVELVRAVKPAALTPETPSILNQKAEDVLSKVSSAAPNTLSDIPGGSPPKSDNQSLDDMSTQEVGSMFENMTDEQLEAALAKLG